MNGATLPLNIPQSSPLLIIVSGPSGVGKDTALRRMRELKSSIHFVVTCTTRPKRPDEVDGLDYHFLTPEQFAEMDARGEFLEHAVVYGYHYGNSRSEVRQALARGQDVIMRIDVQGAATIKRLIPEAVFVFLMPPSMQALEARLRKRRTEPEEYLNIRLHAARLELNEVNKFDYVIVNEDDALDETVALLHAIIQAEHCRVQPRHIQV